MTSDPSCDLVLGGLTDYLEEAAPPLLRPVYERHLHGCPRCSANLSQLTGLLHLLRSLPPERIPILRKHVLIEAFRGRQNAS